MLSSSALSTVHIKCRLFVRVFIKMSGVSAVRSMHVQKWYVETKRRKKCGLRSHNLSHKFDDLRLDDVEGKMCTEKFLFISIICSI